MNMIPTKVKALGGGLGSMFIGLSLFKQAFYNVETGHKAFKFNKLMGVRSDTYKEGFHLRIPWLEYPIIYNVKTQPMEFRSFTGSKDLQEVQIKVRVLFRPD